MLEQIISLILSSHLLDLTDKQIRNAVKLAFNPNQTQRDEVIQTRVNPVVTFPKELCCFNDKTAQSKPSAFDRINVRRLFITLEKQYQLLLSSNSLSLMMNLQELNLEIL